MKNIWKKYDIWINLGVFLLGMCLAWFYVVMPIRKSIETGADDIQKKMIDSELAQNRISKIPEMEKTQEIFSENQENLKVILSANSEIDFIKKMEALAEETGNKISLKIETKGVVKKPATTKSSDKKTEADIKSELPDMEYLIVQMSLEGDYDAMYNFLNKLENMSNYVNVVSLGMAKITVENEGRNNIVGGPFTNSASSGQSAKTAENGNNEAKEFLKSNLETIVYLEN